MLLYKYNHLQERKHVVTFREHQDHQGVAGIEQAVLSQSLTSTFTAAKPEHCDSSHAFKNTTVLQVL